MKKLIIDNKEYKLHLIPSGILYDLPISMIGNGVVVDPKALLDEIDYIKGKDINPRLMISDRAHLIMPYHIELDAALSSHQGDLAAGSTMRGIAPVYADKMLETVKKWVPITHAAFLDYRVGAVHVSAKGKKVIQQMAKGEKIDIESSGLSKREWNELMTSFGFTEKQV